MNKWTVVGYLLISVPYVSMVLTVMTDDWCSHWKYQRRERLTNWYWGIGTVAFIMGWTILSCQLIIWGRTLIHGNL